MANPTFSGGVTSVPGYGQREQFLFGGTWADGDTWKIEASSTDGNFTLGAGRLYGATWSFLLTFNRRIFAANGSQVNFSDINNVLGWEEQNPGAGFVLFQNNYGPIDTVKAIGSFQGRLVFLGTYNIQIWNIDADPANFSLAQILPNIGTRSPMTVKGLGDLDLMFLHSTGIRSLRARETTLNAFVVDLGSPIDQILQGVLPTMSETQTAMACSVVEPRTGRYWAFVKDTIYVLSYYPQVKVAAWGKYTPQYEKFYGTGTYNGSGQIAVTGLTIGRTYTWIKNSVNDVSVVSGSTTLTATGQFTADATTATMNGTIGATNGSPIVEMVTFVPEKFVVLNDVIFGRTSTSHVVAYGGVTGFTYDTTQVTVQLPWLDDASPSMMKHGDSVDLNGAGRWLFYAGMDPKSSTYTQIGDTGSDSSPSEQIDATFDYLRFGCPLKGTHFSLKALSSPFSRLRATLSGFVFKYNKGNQ